MELWCAVNLSEGRRSQVIRSVVQAASLSCVVADVSPDPDHNRTVVTLLGSADSLVEGILQASRTAVEQIDISVHQGQHPWLGAVDVVPFTPLEATMDRAVDCAEYCARQLWCELGVPCFLYEYAARTPEACSLPWIRRHAFREMPPDFGGSLPHPTAGASVVGARPPLVAFNINLDSNDIQLARSIASDIRGTLPGVRALGLMMTGPGHAQVSVNITRTLECTMWDVYSAVDRLARLGSSRAASSELVGLAPRHSFGVLDHRQLKLHGEPKILEEVLADLPD